MGQSIYDWQETILTDASQVVDDNGTVGFQQLITTASSITQPHS